jgi:hypothetical protein
VILLHSFLSKKVCAEAAGQGGEDSHRVDGQPDLDDPDKDAGARDAAARDRCHCRLEEGVRVGILLSCHVKQLA